MNHTAETDDEVPVERLQQPAFGPQAMYATGDAPTSVAIGDLNQDGKRDLVVTNSGIAPSNGSVSVLLGLGDGTFGTQATFEVGMFAVSDVNRDEIPDLVQTLSSEGVIVLPGTGDGTFGDAVRLSLTKTPRGIEIADMDGDGTQDLVIANDGAMSVSVTLASAGGFGAPTYYDTGQVSRSVRVADVDGDQQPDVVSRTTTAR